MQESPKAPCPHCRSQVTVKTTQSMLKAFYFCLDCGKAFEVKLPSSPAAT